MAQVASILRILRVSRILTRVKKLRSLASALFRAFSGVLWILVLVVVTTYCFAILGMMRAPVAAALSLSLFVSLFLAEGGSLASALCSRHTLSFHAARVPLKVGVSTFEDVSNQNLPPQPPRPLGQRQGGRRAVKRNRA